MATEENPHAGQGSVVLDIGGDIGALIVVMPASMEDLEVEIVPTGTDHRGPGPDRAGHDHHDHHEHNHDSHDQHSHDHHDDGHPREGHEHDPSAPPHVAVVARPTPGGEVVHSLVFGELNSGTYDLYVRPDGQVALTATVVGGEVTQTVWPSG